MSVMRVVCCLVEVSCDGLITHTEESYGVCYECCVLLGRGLLRRADHSYRGVLWVSVVSVVRCQVEVCCDGLITRTEESYKFLL